MKELQYLNKYLLKYKWHLIWGFVFVLISNAFQILPGFFVRYSIDLVADNIRVYRAFDRSNVQSDFFQIFARGILIYATLIVMSRLVEYDLKNEIFEHYQLLPVSFYRRNNTGDLMNRISEDVGRVRMYLGPSIMYGLQLFTLFMMLIPVMFMISVKLTLFALIPLPLLSFSIYYVN